MRIQNLLFCSLLFAFFFDNNLVAQVVINEGSNRNYSSIADEDGDFPGWIELYNAGNVAVNLLNYALTDDISNKTKWIFPNLQLLPGKYKTIFCSGKDRKSLTTFVDVVNTGTFNPVVGWNTHTFTTPFYWDGVSNILINTCSFSSAGSTANSVFNQTQTPYFSSVFAYQNEQQNVYPICLTNYGIKVTQRPNIRLNNHTIGNGVAQNSPNNYPAPYGNSYWEAKNQMLIPASELLASGLYGGYITSIAFDVASTDTNTVYDYIDISMKLVPSNEVSCLFEPIGTDINLHTNFKISKSGETIYLFSPTHVQLSSLLVNCNNIDNSIGSFPDASSNISLFQIATPSATNNLSDTFSLTLLAPVFSVPSGIYSTSPIVSITNTNTVSSSIYYTTDGSDPTTASTLYTGTPVNMFYFSVLKARAFGNGDLPSPITVSTYLKGVNYTPVLSVITDPANLYGTKGIFDNWQYTWEKAAYVEYFDLAHHLIFSQKAGIQIDGGYGESRSLPQHSFRIELDNAVLGSGNINYPLIPNRSYRTKYNKLFLRNGSNMYWTLPYKDACLTEAMGGESNNYYSAWRPVSVYINGSYYGLYELREKLDAEYFKILDNANSDSLDILTQSDMGGNFLQPVKGSVDSFFSSYDAYKNLNPVDTAFWSLADKYFDMTWYNDYVIAESWAGNKDWLFNNIRIYRSNKTNYRWRFCLMDIELALGPGGSSDCFFDHIEWMLNYDHENPYINIWQRGMQNTKFKNYFINRFADLMNTSYCFNRLSSIENSMYSQTVYEMQNQYARWGDLKVTDFINNHDTFQLQLSERTAQVRNHIQSNFSLSGQVEVTLDVFPAGAGKIKISTIFPNPLPWTGVYFNGNPVKITAFPNPGYNFAYWDTNTVLSVHDTNSSIYLNISSNAVFKAVFTVSQFAGKISISELNYHSDSTRDAGDWIEFHNYGNGPLDISGWKFTDSTYNHNYIFPAGTILQPDTWLVLAEDTLKFHSQHAGIPVLGPTDFGFSNSNEPLTLFDYSNEPVIWMHYDDSLPWPPAADGYGRTLELVNDTLDPALPGSWFAGCIGGSPGGPYITCPEKIIFSEINYKSSPTADAGDWVEIHNKSAVDIDISEWEFRDSKNTHIYTFPPEMILHSNEYLVLFNDYGKFSFQFPAVSNIKGPFTFGLGSTDEAIRLFDNSGRLYQSVVYNKDAPWPQGADGNGYTLEILNPQGNFCDGTNWFDGCPKGSPGGPYINPCNTAIVELPFSSLGMKIFPNPSSGKFTINEEEKPGEFTDIVIEIFNLLGEKVYSITHTKYQSPIEIDISNSPDGIYVVKIYQREKIYIAKIAKL